MSSRPTRTEYYLAMLKLVASRSTCARRAVGAIITDKEGHVLSTGYNGVPANFEHCVDVPCRGATDKPGDNTYCMAVHAEQNAIMQCHNLDSASTIYVTCTPCFSCAKMVANTKITLVIAEQDYADQRGKDVLSEAGVALVIGSILYDPHTS